MLDQLSPRPNIESLQKFLKTLIAAKKQEIAAIILFGSMAKDDYSATSDYDVFIIIKKSETRFIDRILEFSYFSDGKVEPLAYTIEEVQKMFQEYHPLLLEVLKDGIVLHDTSMFWNQLRKEFKIKLETGRIIPQKRGWTINP